MSGPPGTPRARRHRGLRRTLVTAAAVLIVCASVVTGTLGAPRRALASATAPSSPSGSGAGALPASTSASELSLVSQTPTLNPGKTAAVETVVRLRTAPVPGAQLAVAVCPLVTTRDAFDASLRAQSAQSCTSHGTEPVASLPVVDGGARRVTLPVYQPNGSSTPPAGGYDTFYPSQSNGVYPMELTLEDAQGNPLAPPLTTYIVSAPDVKGLPKLRVSWVLPVAATSSPASPLTAAEAGSVEGEIAALAGRSVPLTLAVDPSTLSRLSATGPRGQAAVSRLASTVGGRDELLPEPFVPIDVASMAAAGQGEEVAAEFAAGATELRQALGHSPAMNAWAFNSAPVPSAAVAEAASMGASEIAVPDSALSQLPQGKFSNASTTRLSGAGNVTMVAGSDATLALHFTDTGDQVLQATQLLAELSVIDLEQPSVVRGVAVVVPPGWQPTPAFLTTALGGLATSPLLQSATLARLFATVPRATDGNGTVVSRTLRPAPPAPAAPPTADLGNARDMIAGLAATLPTSAPTKDALEQQVLLAESSALAPGQRKAVLRGVTSKVTAELHNIQLAHQVSVTLTSTSGSIPVTIVNNGTTSAQVQLVLGSQKLLFRPLHSTAGTCAAAPGDEVCNLTLTPGATVVKVPVETRTSGVFALDLSLRSGDGGIALPDGHLRYTIRSTAVSDVAVGLMVVAALLLGVWWVRDRRHGRRARKLVEPPDEPDDGTAPIEGAVTAAASPPDVPRWRDRQRRGDSPPPAPSDSDERWTPAPPPRRLRAKSPVDPPPRDDGAGHGEASPEGSAAPPSPADDGVPAEERHLWVDADPVVAEFFASPPPSLPPQEAGSSSASRHTDAGGGPPGGAGR